MTMTSQDGYEEDYHDDFWAAKFTVEGAHHGSNPQPLVHTVFSK
jgi:hypothetical protein